MPSVTQNERFLEIRGASKTFGSAVALQATDLIIEEGEFLSLLGPSGSGKTTMLRMIAGFTEPSSGRIYFRGDDITRLDVRRRPFRTVFQDYALFPHMSVLRNVEYGLRIQGMPITKRKSKAAAAIEMVGLSGRETAYPNQLSGGQRQRVALARALVCEPEVILLDEPLSALDATLRLQLQGELKDIQARLGRTFIFVTHDQDEAMRMSDRIAVMDRARVEQVGTPQHLYRQPATEFVASFFGTSSKLAVKEVREAKGRTAFGWAPIEKAGSGQNVNAYIRPEAVDLDRDDQGPGTVERIEFSGDRLDITVEAEGEHLKLRAPSSKWSALSVGDRVSVSFVGQANAFASDGSQ